MKYFIVAILFLFSQLSYSQKKVVEDITPTDAEKAKEQIVKLHDGGALVIRLFLTKKKIELYRKYGDEKLANKLEKKLAVENKLFTTAFSDSTFSFCPVYFINTKDYGRVINGEKSGYFLNSNLEIDSSIVMKEDYFFFVERGPVYDQVGLDNSFKKSETTDAAVLTDALVIKDLEMNQLAKPFPFYKKIFFPNNLKSNVGFYMPTKNDTKGGTWYYTPPLTLIEKLDLREKKDEYTSSIQLIEEKTGLSRNELISISKNITTYYKNEYGFKKTELTLPFNIYRLNVQLYNYYYSTISKIERKKSK